MWTIIRHTTARFVLDQKCFQTNLVSISDKEQRTSASLKSETTVPKGSEVSVRCVLKLSLSLIGSGAGKTHTHHLFTTSEFQNVNYFLIKFNFFLEVL